MDVESGGVPLEASEAGDALAEDQPLERGPRDLPPKPSQHVCTDLSGLVFLFVNVVAFSYVSYYAVRDGNVHVLARGFDTKNRVCGIDVPESYLFWPRDPDTLDIIAERPMCIDECPGLLPNSSRVVNTTSGLRTLADEPTTRVGHICFPMPSAAVGEEEGDRELQGFVNHVLGYPMVDAVLLIHIYEDIRINREYILPIVTFVGIFVGYVFLYLLNMCAECLAYMVMVGLVMTCLGGGASWIWNAHCQTDVELGLLMLFAGSILAPWFNSLRDQLHTAVGCIEASTECLFQEPTLLMEPFVSVVARIGLVGACAYHFLLLMTSVPMQPIGHCGLRKVPVLTVWHAVAAVYSIFVYIWVNEMQHLSAHYITVWTTQHWYFAPYVDGEKQYIGRCNLLSGICSLFRYHLGTVSLGGLLIAYTRPLRLVVHSGLQISKMQNPVAKMISCCLLCFESLYRAVAHVKKEAIMDVAVNSSPFLEAADRAHDLLHFEVSAVSSLNGTQFIFKVCGVALVGMSTQWAILMFFTLSEQFLGFGVKNVMRLGLVCAFLGAFIGHCFMHVFDAVGDTILYCFALEHRRRNMRAQLEASTEQAQPSLWGFLFGEEESETEEEEEYGARSLHSVLKKYGS